MDHGQGFGPGPIRPSTEPVGGGPQPPVGAVGQEVAVALEEDRGGVEPGPGQTADPGPVEPRHPLEGRSGLPPPTVEGGQGVDRGAGLIVGDPGGCVERIGRAVVEHQDPAAGLGIGTGVVAGRNLGLRPGRRHLQIEGLLPSPDVEHGADLTPAGVGRGQLDDDRGRSVNVTVAGVGPDEPDPGHVAEEADTGPQGLDIDGRHRCQPIASSQGLGHPGDGEVVEGGRDLERNRGRGRHRRSLSRRPAGPRPTGR